jgi:type II secretory pathway component PulC
MRQPLWLLNSSLFFLFLVALCLAFLLRQKPLHWISIEPTTYIKMIKKEVSATEIAKIYENDLFDTYQKEEEKKEKPLEHLMPAPPTPQAAVIPEPEVPTFLEPLQATLRGVIVVGDDRKNRIIIENTKTKEEGSLHIGETFEDAQLLRIFRNRAIFIRSNGQEETLYLTEKDAAGAPEALGAALWEDVIKKTSDTTFIVDPAMFVEYVTSLAQFIEDLDLITVYRKGQPFGTRVGKVEEGSFGSILGLQVGDIITKINGTPATDISKRVEIYNKVRTLPLGQTITVNLLRHNTEEIKLSLKLQELEHSRVVTLGGQPRKVQELTKTIEDIEKEKEEIMQQKYSFAPTVNEIKKREKQVILKKVKKKELQHKKEEGSKFEL